MLTVTKNVILCPAGILVFLCACCSTEKKRHAMSHPCDQVPGRLPHNEGGARGTLPLWRRGSLRPRPRAFGPNAQFTFFLVVAIGLVIGFLFPPVVETPGIDTVSTDTSLAAQCSVSRTTRLFDRDCPLLTNAVSNRRTKLHMSDATGSTLTLRAIALEKISAP